jgi:hypothetical protein
MSDLQKTLSRRSILRNAAAVVGVTGASALTAACGSSRPAPPPPPAPVAPPAPPPPVAAPAPPPPPPVAAAKEPKREARYQNHPHGRERCGRCVHFLAPNGCEIVEGRISPRGWCRHFEAKA